MDLEEYRELKKTLDSVQSRLDRLEGAQEQLRARLDKEFGCQTLATAKKMLEKLTREQDKKEKEYETEFAQFQKKWSDKLEG